MKKLALTFLILLGLAGFARAEEEPKQEIGRLPTINDCGEWKTVNAILMTEFGEEPFVVADGAVDVIVPGSVVRVEHRLVIYVNPDTFSYSIVALFVKDDMACVLSSGVDFRPIRLPPEGTKL